MADSNPWSAEDWSLTAQAAYFKRYGRARAEARARDAGSYFGAASPPLAKLKKIAPKFGKPIEKKHVLAGPPKAIGLKTDHLNDHQKRVLYFVRKRKNQAPQIFARPQLGLDVAALLTLERIDFDFAAAAALGVSESVLLQLERDLAAAASLGISESVLLQIERDLTAAVSLGISESVTIQLERDLAATAALGISESATLQLERDLAAAASLGISQSAIIRLERDLTAAVALGISMAAAIQVPHLLLEGDASGGALLLEGDQSGYLVLEG